MRAILTLIATLAIAGCRTQPLGPNQIELPDMIVADLKSTPDLVVLPDLTPLADLASHPDLIALPDLMATSGVLTVKASSETAASTNYLMGMLDQHPGVFTLCADPFEDIRISQIVLSFWHNGEGASKLPTNIRLTDWDTGKPIGQSVAQLGTVVNGKNTMLPQYGHAVFEGLTHSIPRGICKDVVIEVDFATYEAGGFTTTGQQIVPAILASYSNTLGKDLSITAVGLTSGRTITPTVVTNPNWKVPGAYGNMGTLYRTKLITSWAADTPAGKASPNGGQITGKLVVTNLANSGTYPSTIETLNVNLATNIKPLATPRVLTIYKDSLATAPLTMYVFKPGQMFGATAIKPADFSDVMIASGTSKTFYVTLDTSEAKGGDSLSIQVNSGGVEWSDGVSQDLSAMGSDLPLAWKTFVY